MPATVSGILLYGTPFRDDDIAREWGAQFEGPNGALRRERIAVETGCDIEYLGSAEFGPPMPYVIASRAENTGEGASAVTPIVATELWHDRLRRFAAATGLNPQLVERPGWYLTCSH